MRVVGIALVLVPLAAGCYFSTDFSGLAGLEPDAAGGVPEAGATDAGADADAGSDAGSGDAGVDGAADFCLGATFCDQFEREAAKGDWDDIDDSAGSKLDLTTERARSGTTALRAILGPSEPVRAYVLERVTVVAQTMRLEVSMFLGSTPGRVVNLPGVSFRYGERRLSLLFVADTHLRVAEQEFDITGSIFFDSKASVPLVLGRWATLGLEVDLRVIPQRMRATYDGEVIFDGPLLRGGPPAAPEIAVGAPFARMGMPLTIDFDDVRVDVTP